MYLSLKTMDIFPNLGSVILAICVILSTIVDESAEQFRLSRELSLGDNKLCSGITKRKIKYESLIVTQGRASQHSLPWTIPDICKFEMQSVYAKGGVIAVIQKMHLRVDPDTGECIDYIQFRTKDGRVSRRYCGSLDARFVMDKSEDQNVDLIFVGINSDNNSFVDEDGELDVVIYIAKQALEPNERSDFQIVFTSYKDCSDRSKLGLGHMREVILRECDINKSYCINAFNFEDGYVNCPQFGCVDEGGCHVEIVKAEMKPSIGNRVIIGSVSTLCILFAVFILIIWAFRKHKLFCWAEQFAHPSRTPESNRNSRVIEMNEQTGARLAENLPSTATAPVFEEDKDLPPSYESLFPDTSNNSR